MSTTSAIAASLKTEDKDYGTLLAGMARDSVINTMAISALENTELNTIKMRIEDNDDEEEITIDSMPFAFDLDCMLMYDRVVALSTNTELTSDSQEDERRAMSRFIMGITSKKNKKSEKRRLFLMLCFRQHADLLALRFFASIVESSAKETKSQAYTRFYKNSSRRKKSSSSSSSSFSTKSSKPATSMGKLSKKKRRKLLLQSMDEIARQKIAEFTVKYHKVSIELFKKKIAASQKFISHAKKKQAP